MTHTNTSLMACYPSFRLHKFANMISFKWFIMFKNSFSVSFKSTFSLCLICFIPHMTRMMYNASKNSSKFSSVANVAWNFPQMFIKNWFLYVIEQKKCSGKSTKLNICYTMIILIIIIITKSATRENKFS